MTRKSRLIVTPPHIKCELCSEHFIDHESFDAHQRAEIGRNIATKRFLSMPKLPKCFSKEAMWAMSFRSKKFGKTLHIWTKPKMPKKRAHRVNPDDSYTCLFCRKMFRDARPFMAHFVNVFTPVERCLDSDELTALDYEQSASGIYRATPFTQLLPSQAARLPSVRADLERLEAAEKAKRDLERIREQAQYAASRPASVPITELDLEAAGAPTRPLARIERSENDFSELAAGVL